MSETSRRLEVQFVDAKSGGVMAADRVDGRVAFPDSKGPQPAVGEWWEVEIAGENKPKCSVWFLRCLRKVEAPAAVNAGKGRVLGVFRPDGSPAAEGVDYYGTASGITSRTQVWAVVQSSSTHSAADDRKSIHGLNVHMTDGTVGTWGQELCGPWYETPTQPACPKGVPDAVYRAALALAPEKDRQRWATLSSTTRISVNDSRHSGVVAVFLPDGSPAVEGRDYFMWHGEYHKNGKWSYGEGGIASAQEVWAVIQHRSAHGHSFGITGINVPGAESKIFGRTLCRAVVPAGSPAALPRGHPRCRLRGGYGTCAGGGPQALDDPGGTLKRLKIAEGAKMLGIFRPDGSPAAEGSDYSRWSDESHGGIACSEGKELWYVVNSRSTHHVSNNQKTVVRTTGGAWHLCGPWGEQPVQPPCPAGVPDVVYQAIIALAPEEHRQRWQTLDATTRFEIKIEQIEAAILPDGSLAIKDQNYWEWTGKYTPNGKWSTTEQGVAVPTTQEVWFLNRYRGHGGRVRHFVGINVGEPGKTCSIHWCADWSTMTETPARPEGVPEAVYIAVLEVTREAREQGVRDALAAAKAAMVSEIEAVSAAEVQAQSDAEQAAAEGLTRIFEELGNDLGAAQHSRTIAQAAVEACSGDMGRALKILESELNNQTGYGREKQQVGLRKKLGLAGVEWSEKPHEQILVGWLSTTKGRSFSPYLYGAVLWLEGQVRALSADGSPGGCATRA